MIPLNLKTNNFSNNDTLFFTHYQTYFKQNAILVVKLEASRERVTLEEDGEPSDTLNIHLVFVFRENP